MRFHSTHPVGQHQNNAKIGSTYSIVIFLAASSRHKGIRAILHYIQPEPPVDSPVVAVPKAPLVRALGPYVITVNPEIRTRFTEFFLRGIHMRRSTREKTGGPYLVNFFYTKICIFGIVITVPDNPNLTNLIKLRICWQHG